jgi:hypothetical protein
VVGGVGVGVAEMLQVWIYFCRSTQTQIAKFQIPTGVPQWKIVGK